MVLNTHIIYLAACFKILFSGAVIGTADLDDKSSLECAVRSADVMFLVTHYWEHMDQRKEIQQVSSLA